MEGFFEALGAIGLILLILLGLAAGWIASAATGGRHKARYLALGVAAALAVPFLLAAIGVGILAAGGLLAILAAAALGAVLVLLIARAIFD
jgi:uncharacterized membrane protein YeaQ/YmgE (transglycosylase-associated protein family)